MQNFLAITTLIDNSNEVIMRLLKMIKSSGCNITESRFDILGEKLAVMLFLCGSWNEIAKMEDSLKKLERSLRTTILHERTTSPELEGKAMPYAIDVVGIDQAGVILDITEFITGSNLSITELSSNMYIASTTGAKMFSLHMTVSIPLDTSIAAMRSDFIEFCDRLNLDAIMEPVK